jgi:hypothetical protein
LEKLIAEKHLKKTESGIFEYDPEKLFVVLNKKT